MISLTLSFSLTLGCATHEANDLEDPQTNTSSEGTEPVQQDTADPEAPEAPEDPDPVFQPIEGAWEIIGEQMRWDDCNMQEWVIGDTTNPMQLVMLADGRFSLSHGEGTDICDLAEQAYTCVVRTTLDTTPEEDYGLDAVLNLEMTPSGTFEGSDRLILNTDVLVSCEGDACWLVELSTSAMPCTMGVETVAQAL
jgi:hypothetical protein